MTDVVPLAHVVVEMRCTELQTRAIFSVELIPYYRSISQEAEPKGKMLTFLSVPYFRSC